jgi:NADH:ubiquinone oxidoreductase subunit 4 (subunit M)
LVPIAVACIGIGVYPKIMLDVTEPSAANALVAFPEKVNAWNAAHGKPAPAKVAMQAKEVSR